MPEVKMLDIHDPPGMGVSIEFSDKWYPKTDSLILPEFDKYNQQTYYLEIFNQGNTPFKYSIESDDTWIEFSESKGQIETQKRIWISIDWKSIPVGNLNSSFTIKGSEGSELTIHIVVNSPFIQFSNEFNGFVVNNGFISIEAEHFTKAVNTDEITWKIIPNLGRTNSGITPFPVTASTQEGNVNSPCLEYQIYLFNEGEISVGTYLSPTLNFQNKPEGIRYVISIDDQPPQIVNMTNNPNSPDLNYDRVWNRWVADNINISVSKHKIDKPGEHVLKIWMVDPGVVLQKIVINCGGLKTSYLGPPESFNYTK